MKRDALTRYASQMTDLIDDDPNGFCFTEAQLAPSSALRIFHRVAVMTDRRPTLQPAYFEAIYQRDPDPWRFRTSDYGGREICRDAGLPHPPAVQACARGRAARSGFSRLLSARCDALVSIDLSDRALEIARQECADLSHVEFRRAAVPDEFPVGQYDLIILSEVLYYLAEPDVRRVADQVAEALAPGGEVVLCHWLGESDYPLSGDEAAICFLDATLTPFPARHAIRKPEYRLDRLSAARSPSDA